MIKIGVINISDRASAGIYEDIPGKAVVELLNEYIQMLFIFWRENRCVLAGKSRRFYAGKFWAAGEGGPLRFDSNSRPAKSIFGHF